MAFKVFLLFLFFCIPRSASATSCDYNGDCFYPEKCCKDGVCRETCHHCSHDFQCGTGECCGANRNCRKSCSDSVCECGSLQSCCLDGVCRQKCNYCKYDTQCGTGECCNSYGNCKKSCNSKNSGAVIAGIIVSISVFVAIFVTIVACFHCACCPYYRHRPRRTVAVQLEPTVPTAPTQRTVEHQRPILMRYSPGVMGPYDQPPPPYTRYP